MKLREITIIKRASCTIQLLLWVIGINKHNVIRDECTPDFSCCSNLRTSFKDRLKNFKRHFITSITGL